MMEYRRAKYLKDKPMRANTAKNKSLQFIYDNFSNTKLQGLVQKTNEFYLGTFPITKVQKLRMS